jgi:hypothetical protein
MTQDEEQEFCKWGIKYAQQNWNWDPTNEYTDGPDDFMGCDSYEEMRAAYEAGMKNCPRPHDPHREGDYGR